MFRAVHWMQRHESYEYPVLGITGGARRWMSSIADGLSNDL